MYEGLATDSYSVDTGSAGSFTACISFLGYPIFFKEDHIYKVYGSIPTNFEVMGSATLGVAAGSDRSLAIAGEILFYHSRAGIMAYSGGIPQPVGAAFGVERFEDAVGGSDGLKYYVSMAGKDGAYLLYVYDTQRGGVAHRGRHPVHTLCPLRRKSLSAGRGREHLDHREHPESAGRGNNGGCL